MNIIELSKRMASCPAVGCSMNLHMKFYNTEIYFVHVCYMYHRVCS